MGTFTVRLQVGDPTGTRFEEVEALVDTGASNTLLPEDLLERLGIKPGYKAPFELADGRQVDLAIGWTRVKVNGNQDLTQVVFGEKGVQPLLGAFTLEGMGLGVDPIGRRLIPVPRLLPGLRKA